LPGDGLPGTNGTVHAVMTWDPDGIGPHGGVLVVGGTFTAAGDAQANNIAIYDPVTGDWSSLGSGMTGLFGVFGTGVNALGTLSNGDLVAGGTFAFAGGVAASNIARWNGTQWSPLGSGTSASVSSLCSLPNGHLVAGGVFTTAGGVAANWPGPPWELASARCRCRR